MNKSFIFLALIAGALCVSVNKLVFKEEVGKFTSKNGALAAMWTVSNDQKSVNFEITGKTKGWVGIGFNNASKMAGAELVYGWVDSENNVHLFTGFAKQHGQPEQIGSQKITNIRGAQNGHQTTIYFTRPSDPTGEKGSKDLRTKQASHILMASSLKEGNLTGTTAKIGMHSEYAAGEVQFIKPKLHTTSKRMTTHGNKNETRSTKHENTKTMTHPIKTITHGNKNETHGTRHENTKTMTHPIKTMTHGNKNETHGTKHENTKTMTHPIKTMTHGNKNETHGTRHENTKTMTHSSKHGNTNTHGTKHENTHTMTHGTKIRTETHAIKTHTTKTSTHKPTEIIESKTISEVKTFTVPL